MRTVWTGRIRFDRDDSASADRMERVLRPESDREVRRVRVRLGRPSPVALEVEMTSNGTSSLRAALNTYLGWAALFDATERVAQPSSD